MSARKTAAQGRPLVFLAMIAFGWIGIRAVALSLPDVPAAFSPDNDSSPVLSEAAPAPAPRMQGDGQAAGVPAPRVTDGLVEGLSEVPPAHMSQEINTSQSLAGHNSLDGRIRRGPPDGRTERAGRERGVSRRRKRFAGRVNILSALQL